MLVRHAANNNSKFYNEYWSFVGNFANTIVNAAKKYELPELTSLTKLDEVASVFPPATRAAPATAIAGETGPRYVQFICDFVERFPGKFSGKAYSHSYRKRVFSP